MLRMCDANQNNSNKPITVTELVQLTQLGVPLEDVTWQRVTMTSDKSICVRYGDHQRHYNVNGKVKNSRGSAVAVLAPNKSNYPFVSGKTVASSAKINPLKPLIALKARNIFQVYDLETHKLLLKYKISFSALFWTWVDHQTIAIVTESSIYHWNIFDDNGPVKMFCRHPRLTADSQIINYVCDVDCVWMAVVGISSQNNKVVGVAQLYSSYHNCSQPLEAHAVCFTTYCFNGNAHPSKVFIAASRSEIADVGKIHVIELGPHKKGNSALINHCDSFDFQCNTTWAKYDFPVSVQTSLYGLAYVLSKYGFVYLFDIESGLRLLNIMVCPDITFTSALNSHTQGIMVISRNGQVLAVDIEESQICDYARIVLKKPALADRLFNCISEFSNSKVPKQS